MSKTIYISKKPRLILVVDDDKYGIYFYLVDNVVRARCEKYDIGVWHITYKTKLDN